MCARARERERVRLTGCKLRRRDFGGGLGFQVGGLSRYGNENDDDNIGQNLLENGKNDKTVTRQHVIRETLFHLKRVLESWLHCQLVHDIPDPITYGISVESS